MTGNHVSSAIRHSLLVLAIAASLAGCANLQPHYSGPVQTTPAPAQVEPQTAAEPDPAGEPPQREMLAAIADFLERTGEYGLSPETQPLPEITRTAVTPPSWDSAPAGPRAARAAVEPRQVVSEAVAPETAIANTRMVLTDAEPAATGPALPVVKRVTIRSAQPKPTPQAAPPDNTTNEPMEFYPNEAVVTVDKFLEHLEAAHQQNRDFDSEWQLRLVRAALNREDQSGESATNLSPNAWSILTDLIRVGVAARRVARNPLLSGEEALTCVDDLRLELADRADPIISTIALCRKVVTFGVFEELDADRFVAGRSVAAIVYSSIRNLRSEQTSDGRYQARLATRLEVLTAAGQPVWQHEEPEIVDTCRERRTDFFVAQRIVLPPTLVAGDYVLKVMVEDKLAERTNEGLHRFSIAASTSVASRRSGWPP